MKSYLFVCVRSKSIIASKFFCVCVPALAGRNPVPGSLPLHLERLVGVQAEGGELAGAVTMRRAGGQQRGLPENKVIMSEQNV